MPLARRRFDIDNDDNKRTDNITIPSDRRPISSRPRQSPNHTNPPHCRPYNSISLSSSCHTPSSSLQTPSHPVLSIRRDNKQSLRRRLTARSQQGDRLKETRKGDRHRRHTSTSSSGSSVSNRVSSSGSNSKYRERRHQQRFASSVEDSSLLLSRRFNHRSRGSLLREHWGAKLQSSSSQRLRPHQPQSSKQGVNSLNKVFSPSIIYGQKELERSNDQSRHQRRWVARRHWRNSSLKKSLSSSSSSCRQHRSRRPVRSDSKPSLTKSSRRISHRYISELVPADLSSNDSNSSQQRRRHQDIGGKRDKRHSSSSSSSSNSSGSEDGTPSLRNRRVSEVARRLLRRFRGNYCDITYRYFSNEYKSGVRRQIWLARSNSSSRSCRKPTSHRRLSHRYDPKSISNSRSIVSNRQTRSWSSRLSISSLTSTSDISSSLILSSDTQGSSDSSDSRRSIVVRHNSNIITNIINYNNNNRSYQSRLLSLSDSRESESSCRRFDYLDRTGLQDRKSTLRRIRHKKAIPRHLPSYKANGLSQKKESLPQRPPSQLRSTRGHSDSKRLSVPSRVLIEHSNFRRDLTSAYRDNKLYEFNETLEEDTELTSIRSRVCKEEDHRYCRHRLGRFGPKADQVSALTDRGPVRNRGIGTLVDLGSLTHRLPSNSRRGRGLFSTKGRTPTDVSHKANISTPPIANDVFIVTDNHTTSLLSVSADSHSSESIKSVAPSKEICPPAEVVNSVNNKMVDVGITSLLSKPSPLWQLSSKTNNTDRRNKSYVAQSAYKSPPSIRNRELVILPGSAQYTRVRAPSQSGVDSNNLPVGSGSLNDLSLNVYNNSSIPLADLKANNQSVRFVAQDQGRHFDIKQNNEVIDRASPPPSSPSGVSQRSNCLRSSDTQQSSDDRYKATSLPFEEDCVPLPPASPRRHSDTASGNLESSVHLRKMKGNSGWGKEEVRYNEPIGGSSDSRYSGDGWRQMGGHDGNDRQVADQRCHQEPISKDISHSNNNFTNSSPRSTKRRRPPSTDTSNFHSVCSPPRSLYSPQSTQNSAQSSFSYPPPIVDNNHLSHNNNSRSSMVNDSFNQNNVNDNVDDGNGGVVRCCPSTQGYDQSRDSRGNLISPTRAPHIHTDTDRINAKYPVPFDMSEPRSQYRLMDLSSTQDVNHASHSDRYDDGIDGRHEFGQPTSQTRSAYKEQQKECSSESLCDDDRRASVKRSRLESNNGSAIIRNPQLPVRRTVIALQPHDNAEEQYTFNRKSELRSRPKAMMPEYDKDDIDRYPKSREQHQQQGHIAHSSPDRHQDHHTSAKLSPSLSVVDQQQRRDAHDDDKRQVGIRWKQPQMDQQLPAARRRNHWRRDRRPSRGALYDRYRSRVPPSGDAINVISTRRHLTATPPLVQRSSEGAGRNSDCDLRDISDMNRNYDDGDHSRGGARDTQRQRLRGSYRKISAADGRLYSNDRMPPLIYPLPLTPDSDGDNSMKRLSTECQSVGAVNHHIGLGGHSDTHQGGEGDREREVSAFEWQHSVIPHQSAISDGGVAHNTNNNSSLRYHNEHSNNKDKSGLPPPPRVIKLRHKRDDEGGDDRNRFGGHRQSGLLRHQTEPFYRPPVRRLGDWPTASHSLVADGEGSLDYQSTVFASPGGGEQRGRWMATNRDKADIRSGFDRSHDGRFLSVLTAPPTRRSRRSYQGFEDRWLLKKGILNSSDARPVILTPPSAMSCFIRQRSRFDDVAIVGCQMGQSGQRHRQLADNSSVEYNVDHNNNNNNNNNNIANITVNGNQRRRGSQYQQPISDRSNSCAVRYSRRLHRDGSVHIYPDDYRDHYHNNNNNNDNNTDNTKNTNNTHRRKLSSSMSSPPTYRTQTNRYRATVNDGSHYRTSPASIRGGRHRHTVVGGYQNRISDSKMSEDRFQSRHSDGHEMDGVSRDLNPHPRSSTKRRQSRLVSHQEDYYGSSGQSRRRHIDSAIDKLGCLDRPQQRYSQTLKERYWDSVERQRQQLSPSRTELPHTVYNHRSRHDRRGANVGQYENVRSGALRGWDCKNSEDHRRCERDGGFFKRNRAKGREYDREIYTDTKYDDAVLKDSYGLSKYRYTSRDYISRNRHKDYLKDRTPALYSSSEYQHHYRERRRYQSRSPLQYPLFDKRQEGRPSYSRHNRTNRPPSHGEVEIGSHPKDDDDVRGDDEGGSGPLAKKKRRGEDEIVHFEWRVGMKLSPTLTVKGLLGEGTFGRVLNCMESDLGTEVGVKVVRDVPRYTSAARIESEILSEIQKRDALGESNCVIMHYKFLYHKDRHRGGSCRRRKSRSRRSSSRRPNRIKSRAYAVDVDNDPQCDRRRRLRRDSACDRRQLCLDNGRGGADDDRNRFVNSPNNNDNRMRGRDRSSNYDVSNAGDDSRLHHPIDDLGDSNVYRGRYVDYRYHRRHRRSEQHDGAAGGGGGYRVWSDDSSSNSLSSLDSRRGGRGDRSDNNIYDNENNNTDYRKSKDQSGHRTDDSEGSHYRSRREGKKRDKLDRDREEGRHMCLVFEKLGLSLFAFLSLNGYRGFFLEDIQRMTREVLKALGFLYEIGLTHTDLKPENILFVNDSRDVVELPRSRYAPRYWDGDASDSDSTASMMSSVNSNGKQVGCTMNNNKIDNNNSGTVDVYHNTSHVSRYDKQRRGHCEDDLQSGSRSHYTPNRHHQAKDNIVNYYESSTSSFGGVSRCPPIMEALQRLSPPVMTSRPRSCRVKLIDFGSATFDDDDHCSLINTRQYRAPEVILQTGWSMASDMWSLGCILMELYTGVLLFRTHDHMEHLAMMEKIIGEFPSALLKSAKATDGSKYLRKTSTGHIVLDWPEGAIDRKSVRRVAKCCTLEEMVLPIHRPFADFVRYLLKIDPASRPTPSQALAHPFLQMSLPEA